MAVSYRSKEWMKDRDDWSGSMCGCDLVLGMKGFQKIRETRLGRSDKEVFNQIVHGLDDDVKKLVFLKDVTNVAEYVKLTKMAEAFTEYNSRGTGRQAKPMFKQANDTPGRRQPHGGRRPAGRCERCDVLNAIE
ncbi:hypothetical protein DPMN_004884 [Dreissena polymorpha]|uniref:Uncharacterized protein n=1 Tax=Dreissena polymorpha TaxID=45954 RepID=A0A9D4MTH4_DREPO|nr:hypothetical protein DPMN_004884 [Dreissena polymorpha]